MNKPGNVIKPQKKSGARPGGSSQKGGGSTTTASFRNDETAVAARPDKTILSASNPLFKEWLDLRNSKGIRKQGLFLLSGEAAVLETLCRFPERVRSALICSERHGDSEVRSLREAITGATVLGETAAADVPKHAKVGTSQDFAKTQRTEKASTSSGAQPSATEFSIIALGKPLFNELDIFGTHSPLLLVRLPDLEAADLTREPNGIEILCALGDPSNVGALLRSAAAFGASKVILLKESASPFHPRSVRAASATTFLTKLETGPSIHDLTSVVKATHPIVALDMNGESLSKFAWPKNVRLLIGEEGPGIPKSANFKLVAIPMQNDVESLNATIAASIALYSYRSGHE